MNLHLDAVQPADTDLPERRVLEQGLPPVHELDVTDRVAGDIAKRFCDLLTVIECHCDLAIRQVSPGNPPVSHLLEIRKACAGAITLSRQLLSFCGHQASEPHALELNGLIRSLLPIMRGLLGESARLTGQLSQDACPILADAGLMQRALINLVLGVRECLPTAGELIVETKNDPPDTVLLTLSGAGFQAADQTLAVGPPLASSICVSAAAELISRSGGAIEVPYPAEGGSSVKARFPKWSGNNGGLQARTPDAGSGTAPRAAEPLIFLVEDESGLRSLVRHILVKQHYRVLEAVNGEDALRILECTAEPIDLLLTDVVMPRVSGPSLARVLLLRNPNLKVIFMSGYAQDELSKHADLQQLRHYLQKPFSPQSLVEKVREILSPQTEDPQ